MSASRNATPEHWARIERWTSGNSACSCLIELRDRIEALEAAANAPADHPHEAAGTVATDAELFEIWEDPVKLEDSLRAVYNLGRQHGAAQSTCHHIITSDEGTSHCGLAEQGNRQATLSTSPPSPASGLVERVLNALLDQPGLRGGPVVASPNQARAAILAVAEWLEKERGEASMLAASWLCDEVEAAE